MTVGIWEPLRQLEQLDKVIDGFFSQSAGAKPEQSVTRPATDYWADAEGYRLVIDLPGVRKEDVDISVEDGVLTVRAQRNAVGDGSKEDTETRKTRKVFLRETRTGNLQRSFRLGTDADVSAVSASMSDGVLEVRVPRLQRPQSRKVEVVGI